MLKLLLRWVLSAAALIVIAYVVPGIHVTLVSALIAALVMGVINVLIRPLLVILTLPITVITLGLFLLVVNAALFGLAALLVPGFKVDGFVPAVIGSLLYWLANWAIHYVFKHEKDNKSLKKAS
ncbi:MAG TPA: phage holin family protein [Ktedonobacterales bacterium]|jgi:putative membrane protein